MSGNGSKYAVTYGPALAVKCLRDGAESANIHFMWQADGYDVVPQGARGSGSYFEAPLCNHTPLRPDLAATHAGRFIGYRHARKAPTRL